MKQSIWTSGSPSNPQAFITKRKQRIKQFEGQIYLNDGDEYEIEIFNPQRDYILAKIKVDNTYLSGGGIVLRPGERVFLERFLDSNNKFVFRTYEVGKEAVNLGAIDNNGYVEVEFYSEWKQQQSYWGGGSNTITLSGNSTYTTGTPYLGNGTFTTRSNPGTYVGGSSSPRISFTGAGAGSWNGFLGYFAIYNRTLSTLEISQNFNALRGRYGI